MYDIKPIISKLFGWLSQGGKKKTKRPPQELSSDIMEEVMKEVKYLRTQHAVDVRNLRADEIPTIPKRADE